MRFIMGLIAMLAFSGCMVKSNVSSFSILPEKYSGKSVSVLGYPKEINDSLEWRTYKPIFEKQFQQKGFIISAENYADYVAYVTYGIGGPQTTSHVGSMPIYGSTGGGTTYHSGTVSTMSGSYGSYSGSSYSMPTYGIVGSSTYSYTKTNYTRTVAINLVDRKSGEKVYESKATSTGSCGMLSEVMDEIAETIFKKFPKGSGTVTVSGKFNC